MEEDKEEELYIEFDKTRKKDKMLFAIILIIACIASALFASEYTLNYYSKQLLTKKDASDNSEKNIEAISDTLKSFRTIIDGVYIGDVDEQKMMDETLKGYVNGLGDEYSQYFTAEEWEDFTADTMGNFVGIGIYMSADPNGNIIIVSPIKESPAEAAGLQSEDIICSVDGESVLGVSSDEVSSKIKGEAGSKVNLTVYRPSEDKYIDFEITRQAIKVYHVESEMLKNNIGYISLATFDEGCAEEFKNAYLELEKKGANKIIIDVRNNTGGLVTEALDIIELFAKKGDTMLITVDSKNEEEKSISELDPIITCPIVILTNEYSASASELTTGALRDLCGAKTVGKNTYGKGVVQSVLMLTDGSALKVTTNEYFTPNKTKVNKVGIAPDYEVELDKTNDIDEQLEKAIEVLSK